MFETKHKIVFNNYHFLSSMLLYIQSTEILSNFSYTLLIQSLIFFQMFRPHFNPHVYPGYSRSLRLNLSDVTEMDEETSIGSSFVDLTGDESPRLLSMDEQKLFNSQFYSLCQVGSNRSLLSAESRIQSLTSLTELLSKSLETLRTGEHEEADPVETAENEAALREFDEISKQIASLSETVDALNLSLCSLNSGEHEASPAAKHDTAQKFDESPTQSSKGTSVDEYHWMEDEFFLTSFNGKTSLLPGSEDFVEACSAGESPEPEVKLRREHSGASCQEFDSIDKGSKRDTWPLADTEGLHHGDRSSFIFRPNNESSLSNKDNLEKHVSTSVLDGKQKVQMCSGLSKQDSKNVSESDRRQNSITSKVSEVITFW